MCFRSFSLPLLVSLVVLSFATAAISAPNAPTKLSTFISKQPSSHNYVWLWTDNSTDETSFEIRFRSSPTGGFSTLHTAAPSAGTGTTGAILPLTALAVGTELHFQVIAKNASGESAPTNTTTIIIPVDSFNPPTAVMANPVSETVVNVTWTDNATTEDGEELELSTDGGVSFSKIADVAFYQQKSINITSLAPGNSGYRIRLRTYKEGNPRTYTSYSSVTSATTPFNAPTNLAATVVNDQQVNLAWTDNSSAEGGVAVYFRPSASGTYMLFDYTAANATAYSVTGLNAGTLYDFQVAAAFQATPTSSIIESVRSNTTTATTKDGFTSPGFITFGTNNSYTYQATTSNVSPRTTWNSASGLPAGMSFSTTTGAITGTPTQFGLFNATLSASFADGSTATLPLAVRVARLPTAPTVTVALPTGQTFAPGDGAATISLTGKFADPDTESAVRLVTTKGNVDVLLYPAATPATVTNFLGYVNRGDYNNSAFHRISDIATSGVAVLQGGQIKPSVSGAAAFTSITAQAAVQNEPGISNLNYTIAMAKQGNNPNSATKEFYFNLTNLNAVLDPPSLNGGFTVFGRVSNATKANLDAVATAPVGGPYSTLVDGVSTNTGFKWPMNVATAGEVPVLMDNTKIMKIVSATPVSQILALSASSSAPGVATAAVVGSDLVITPVGAGQSNVTVTATDLDGMLVTQTFTVTVNQPPAFTNGPPPSPAVVGSAYNFAYTASGFPVPTFSHTGTLPPGLSLSSTGVISGTPTTAGTYSGIVVTASNGIGAAPTQTISITVDQIPSITSAAPAAGIVGTAYTHTYAATGSPAPTYSLTAGALPGGLSVSTAGVISGTPNSAGTFTGTITSTNRAGSFPQAFSITINQAPAFTSSVPTTTGLLGTAYSFTSAASGFPAPTFSVPANALPTGLTLNPTTGEISGTPSATGVFSGTLTASNGIGSNATQAFTITIHQVPVFTNGPPPSPAVVGTAYHFAYTASGFPVPTFSSTGTLPPGLSLSSAGVISGTPTTAGTYPNIVVTASNGIGTAPTQTISITVHRLPTITSSAPSAGVLGIAYSHSFTATGSPAPTFSTAVPLPPGLTLSPAGVLSGTPSALGTFAGTVTATNVAGTSEQAFNIVINQQPAFTNGPPPASGTVGAAYSFSYTASGSPAPTFALTSGALPAGLSLNPSGAISGTPTTAGGPFTGTVTASNGIGTAATQAFSITIAKGTATVTLDGMTLTQTYDGTPKSVTASSTPGGLAIDITYNGSASAPTSHGSHAVLAVVNDPNYNGSASGTLLIQGQSMSHWRTQHFSLEQITAGLADDDADPDGDGWKNLVEYALGMNPMSRNPALLPVRDANGLTLTFTRPKGMPDATYGAQSTDNLNGWNALTLEIVTDGPVQTLRARDPLTNGNPSRRIMRLIFDRPAPIE
jgi:cyclophilin family peptidyl-prolyl cis-trans isomerase